MAHFCNVIITQTFSYRIDEVANLHFSSLHYKVVKPCIVCVKEIKYPKLLDSHLTCSIN